MGLSDENELVEFTDSQTSALSHQESGGGRELKVTLTAIIGLLLPAPHCPLENPPSVKKQEAICSDALCPRKKAHVIPLESRML